MQTPKQAEISAEFDSYRNALPKEQQNSPRLWEKFLLGREDDLSEDFANLINCVLQGDRIEIKKIVEDGKAKEAKDLGKLAEQLAKRLSGMYKNSTYSPNVPSTLREKQAQRIESPVIRLE